MHWSLLILVLGLTAAGYFLFRPLNTQDLKSDPHPARSYAEALQRVEQVRARDRADSNPVCRLQFLTHGKRTKRAIVFVHGYTNCPQQFSDLGKIFYELGYNVLIAALPHHGLADRMTTEHELLTAEELISYADETVDIACGLGEKIVMVGISAGGVTTAYAAQFRSELDRAVIISPAFGFEFLPADLTKPAANLFLNIPNYFDWWDPVRKQDTTPAHAYPRYSTRALAQVLRLGDLVRTAAQLDRPAARSIAVVTNAADKDVNNVLVESVVSIWQEQQAPVTRYEFRADLNLAHDLIDPGQENARTGLVYPVLLDLIGR